MAVNQVLDTEPRHLISAYLISKVLPRINVQCVCQVSSKQVASVQGSLGKLHGSSATRQRSCPHVLQSIKQTFYCI